MFFSRLRRRARWVFLFLAIAFALTFVVAGVGTGVGSGVGDYLAEIFNRQPGTGQPSVDDARKKLEENPKDAAAQKELADALQAEGRTDEAIRALERYTALKPKDTNALQQLAALYDSKALDARQRVVDAQLAAQESLFTQDIQRPDSPLLQALGEGQVVQAVQQETSERTNAALEEMRRAYSQEASIYQKLSLLLPEEPNVFLQLGQSSELSGDTQAAIDAYERFLELAPNDSVAPQVRERLDALRSPAGTPGTG